MWQDGVLLILSSINPSKYYFENGLLKERWSVDLPSANQVNMHFYVLTKDKIKKPDWYYDDKSISVCSRTTDVIINTNGLWSTTKDCRKIVASSEKLIVGEISTPEISSDSIKEFFEIYNSKPLRSTLNFQLGIKVEYEHPKLYPDSTDLLNIARYKDTSKTILKIDEDNNINIQFPEIS